MVRRLLVTYLSLALLILLALAVPLGFIAQSAERQHAFAQLEHEAEVLAAFVDAANGSPGQIDLLANEFGRRWGGAVDIADAAGRVVVSTTRTAAPDRATHADLQAVVVGHERVTSVGRDTTGVEMMSVAVPIHPGKPEQGVLRVSAPTAPMDQRVRQYWGVLAAVSIVVLLAGGVMAIGLARWIGRPVRTLERATRSLADGTLPATSTATGPPELRRLATTFNATAVRLQELIAVQGSFIGHASHQLKTPLAALRLRLENLEPDVAAAGGTNLRAALVETDRLATLVDTLLAMTRSERSVQPCEPVRLADVVAGRVASWGPLAGHRAVTIAPSGPPEARVMAIPGAVEQILDNLISNALAVAPDGSTIAVRWDDAGELHVVDAGPGLSADQRAQALEPFWRAPGAKPGGTGLGLALVRRLAEASGGDVRLDAAAPTGIDAVVTLPNADPNARKVPGMSQASAAG